MQWYHKSYMYLVFPAGFDSDITFNFQIYAF